MNLKKLVKNYMLRRALLVCKRIVSTPLLFLSIVLAVAFVCVGFYMSSKSFGILFGIPLASVGCFVSGWIFGILLRKVVDLGTEGGDIRKELKKKTTENDKLRNECERLKAEKIRLEKQRIDINAFDPIFKLGLVEANMTIKDVKTEWVDDFDKAPWFKPGASDTRSKYVGILQKSFKATYGIDLKKVRVHRGTNCLQVAGITPELIGHKDDEKQWLLRQVQEYPLQIMDKDKHAAESLPDIDYDNGFMKDNKYYGINMKKPFAGSRDMNLISLYSEKQEEDLQNRINNGMGDELHYVNDYIRNMAKCFIEILLAPTKKKIEFVTKALDKNESDPNWLGLKDFAKDFNKRIDKSISALPESSIEVCNSQEASHEVKEEK